MPTRQLVMLARLSKDLDIEELVDLEGRMDAQKRIYLMQLAGINLGYTFAWDLYGPFSRGLARDLTNYHDQIESVDEIANRLNLTNEAEDVLTKVRNIIHVPIEFKNSIDSLEWIELITSVHFIAGNLYPNRKTSEMTDEERGKIYQELIERKPRFKGRENLSEVAFKLLEELETPEKVFA